MYRNLWLLRTMIDLCSRKQARKETYSVHLVKVYIAHTLVQDNLMKIRGKEIFVQVYEI